MTNYRLSVERVELETIFWTTPLLHVHQWRPPCLRCSVPLSTSGKRVLPFVFLAPLFASLLRALWCSAVFWDLLTIITLDFCFFCCLFRSLGNLVPLLKPFWHGLLLTELTACQHTPFSLIACENLVISLILLSSDRQLSNIFIFEKNAIFTQVKIKIQLNFLKIKYNYKYKFVFK